VNLEAKLVGKQRTLVLPAGQISVVYFRAGYTPDDYPSNRQWEGRTIIER
jgi:glutathione synthase